MLTARTTMGHDRMSATVWFLVIFCVGCATLCRLAALKVQARDARGTGAADIEMIQDIHRGLHQMEDRMESLETIIMEAPQPDATSREDAAYGEND